MKEPMIKLIDDNIMEINTDTDYIPGCETCDYGSQYINDISITTEKNGVFRLKINKEYEYGLSSYGVLIKLACDVAEKSSKMTLKEVLLYMQTEILKDCSKPYRPKLMNDNEYEEKHRKVLDEIVKEYFIREDNKYETKNKQN